MKDHERQEELLTKSKLNWTIVRPTGLSNSKREEKIRETFDNESKPGILISRQSVAKYLVDSLEKDSLAAKKVVISKD
ncbi:NAD(P)H-binding protein [Robiginitalea sp.]|uniref:NAD(P)H-binding protein n=1 Tax=Robiginitalea sp. TaxID=1902411 RepID=UPI003C779E8C